MVNEEEDLIKSPQNLKNPPQKSRQLVQNDAHGERKDALFSPRFRSVAAMAGWDEEALMIATLIVEDTPDRHFKQKKRPDNLHNFKTPPTNSRRKRRAQRRSPTSMPVAVLDLEDSHVEPPKQSETKKDITESKVTENEEKKSSENQSDAQASNVCTSTSNIPCMDRLREELSCAICLEICFEPSTTPCGHSFCKKCLRSAADKCGKKCPKCRQLISNGRSCTVNTVLWNTIQMLFPQEVEARKVASALNSRQVQQQSPVRLRLNHSNVRNRNAQESSRSETGNDSPSRRSHHRTRRQSIRPSRMLRRRNELPSQDEDAALALRLQREEFMGAYRGSSDQEYTNSLALATARANLRAMASRAIRGL